MSKAPAKTGAFFMIESSCYLGVRILRYSQLMTMSDLELAYLVAIPGVGRKTAVKINDFLITHDVCLTEFFRQEMYQEPDLLKQKVVTSIATYTQQTPQEKFQELLTKEKIRVISQSSSEYPDQLKPLDDRPLLLFAKGAVFDQNHTPIAVVGTRKITSYGRQATNHLVKEAAQARCSIISGCMYGVDMAAHQAALAQGTPTAGVLGFGFCHVYPASYKKVFAELLANGATLFTEFAPDVQALPGNFPVRNRIVAGISVATIVVEAAIGSGSLITAQCALEYGRVVGAVSGPLTSEFALGTKWLINQGAKLVTTIQDVLEEVPGLQAQQLGNVSTVVTEWDSMVEKKVYDSLSVPLIFDQLLDSTQFTSSELNSILTLLELKQLVKREGHLIQRT